MAVRGEVVADFAPGDEFVEEGFGGGAHIPPACAAAVGAEREFYGSPFFAAGEFRENFVSGEMAEV